MGDIGLLLSLPTGSIAVRVAVASIVAVVLCRVVLRVGLRAPKVRVVLAVIPAIAIALVVASFASQPALPELWYAVDASGGLTVSVRDTYLSFAPAALPLLVGAWLIIAGVRLGRRALGLRAARAELRTLASSGAPAPRRVAATVERLAAAMKIAPPDAVVVPQLPGGAVVHGIRRPLLLLDGPLLARLDGAELAGVLAHELAHVARRDNLVALLLGGVRDVFFFVPGGRWSLGRLLREREHAADVTAVALTERPGALASGLLKVLEAATQRARGPVACSPLLTKGMLVQRVEELCDERPPAGLVHRTAEASVAVGVLIVAVAAAVAVPNAIAGGEREREALGVLMSDVAAAAPQVAASPRSVAFTAFDAVPSVAASEPVTPAATRMVSRSLLALDDPELLHPTLLAACADGLPACRMTKVSAQVTLPARPIVRVDDDAVARWRLEPLMRSADQELGVFWFHRISEGG